MPLYNRDDFELESEILEMASQQLSARVASGEMTGFECLRAEAEIERRKRQAKSKLLKTQQLVGDIKHAKHRVQEAQNFAATHPGGYGEQVVRVAKEQLNKSFAKTRYNQSPFRVKGPDGEEIRVVETLK